MGTALGVGVFFDYYQYVRPHSIIKRSAALVPAVITGLAAYRYLPLERDITFGNGQRYQGAMKNGKYHGHGTMTYPDGPGSHNMRSYSGDYVNGVAQKGAAAPKK